MLLKTVTEAGGTAWNDDVFISPVTELVPRPNTLLNNRAPHFPALGPLHTSLGRGLRS